MAKVIKIKVGHKMCAPSTHSWFQENMDAWWNLRDKKEAEVPDEIVKYMESRCIGFDVIREVVSEVVPKEKTKRLKKETETQGD